MSIILKGLEIVGRGGLGTISAVTKLTADVTGLPDIGGGPLKLFGDLVSAGKEAPGNRFKAVTSALMGQTQRASDSMNPPKEDPIKKAVAEELKKRGL